SSTGCRRPTSRPWCRTRAEGVSRSPAGRAELSPRVCSVGFSAFPPLPLAGPHFRSKGATFVCRDVGALGVLVARRTSAPADSTPMLSPAPPTDPPEDHHVRVTNRARPRVPGRRVPAGAGPGEDAALGHPGARPAQPGRGGTGAGGGQEEGG